MYGQKDGRSILLTFVRRKDGCYTKKATLCFLLGGILAILLLSACTSAKGGNFDSVIKWNLLVWAPTRIARGSASEVTIASVDQPALSLSIPKAWEDMQLLSERAASNSPPEAKHSTILFQLYEKTAYAGTKQWAISGLIAFTKEAFKEKFGDADLATVIRGGEYVLGSDSDYVYLLMGHPMYSFLKMMIHH